MFPHKNKILNKTKLTYKIKIMVIKDLQKDRILGKLTTNIRIIVIFESKIQTKATILMSHKRTVL
jgi:hypothetical protein